MKKILYLIIISTFFNTCAYAAYTVDTVTQSGYVVDEIDEEEYSVYFKHICTWDEIKADKIILNKSELTFHIGDEDREFKLNAEVMPLNATNREVMYSSSNDAVASIDSNGKITTYNTEGEALITVSSGEVTARCKVRVAKAVTGVTLSQEVLQFYADRPVTAVLSAQVIPEDATIKGVEWSTEDASIAAVDSDGSVTPCGVGTTLVTAKTLDGGYVASCEVTVDTWEKRTVEPDLYFTDYSIGLDEVISIQLAQSPTVFTTNTSPASLSDVRQYADPQNFTSGYDIYQFLDLSGSNGIDAETLNNYLTGKGVLENKGSVFIDAAKKYDISEVYLAVHACLESGNGSSQLATGVGVNGTTVYNMFGIGAIDSDPVGGGAQYAYNQGWTTVDAAIRGGAEWLSVNYINSGQNTLYKMRWNPANPGTHQYATDVAWASKQAKTLKNMFGAFPNAELTFEFPIYKNQSEPEIEFD